MAKPPSPRNPPGPVTLSLSGWSLDTTPEFQALADAFHEENPDVTIELKGYDPAEYNTLLTADLAAGSGPDIITQKEVKFVPTFVDGGQLLDVSDVELPDGISGAASYEVDGDRVRGALPQRLVGPLLQQVPLRRRQASTTPTARGRGMTTTTRQPH